MLDQRAVGLHPEHTAIGHRHHQHPPVREPSETARLVGYPGHHRRGAGIVDGEDLRAVHVRDEEATVVPSRPLTEGEPVDDGP